jgi:crotonobetainyl-CoA:carnitine CoA-transferase CaiB-like acyl-CoA transferase
VSALAGLRIVDLSRVLAGPYCTQMLGDLGADVIKIEAPSGDETRAWGPPYLRDSAGNDTGESTYFAAVNRNKRSIVLDLKTPEGAGHARELVQRADVVVENFKVGDLRRAGLSFDEVAATNPGVIYCSITGFGQNGPRAHEPGYDFLIQAMSGLMSITGAAGEEPTKVGVAIVDVLTGAHAATAILAALHQRQTSGRGQHIDMALFDVALAAQVNQAQSTLATGRPPPRLGNAHPSIVPYEIFATADGSLALAIGNDEQFARFCAAAGRPDLASDPRFASNPSRVQHRVALRPTLAAVIAQRPTSAWCAACATAGVPAGPVQDLAQAFTDAQAVARHLRVDLADPELGSLPVVASPLRLSATPVTYRRVPPRQGEHTAEVLAELSAKPV